MTVEIPDDVVSFLKTAGNTRAEALLEKYGFKSSVPELLYFTYYLHDDPDEYQTPGIFADNGVTLPEDEWDEWERKFDKPFYEVTLSCTFNTVTGETRILSIDGHKVVW